MAAPPIRRPLVEGRPLAGRLAIALSASLLCVGVARGQSSQGPLDLEAQLVAAGFFNVAVVADSAGWVVAYENDRFRDEALAARVVADLTDAHLGPASGSVLLALHDAVPLVAVSVPARGSAGAPRPRASFDTAPAVERLRGAFDARRSGIRLGLTVGPEVRAAFGAYDDPIRLQINAAPVLGFLLRPGLRAEAEVIVPLWNELDPAESVVRPGLLTLTQLTQLSRRTFASASIGHFRQERLGVDVQLIHHLPGERWRIGARVGQTRGAAWGLDRPPAGPPDPDRLRLTVQGQVAYRWVPYDLWATATAGRFLFGDEGVRLDARREFGEIDIGFYAIRSGGESNGGVTVALPIPRPQSRQKGRVRIRPAPYFDWEYRYRGAKRVGSDFDTGHDLGDLLRRAHPDRLTSTLALN